MNSGSKPPISGGETQAAAWVQRMFNRIAPRYDLLNHLLSFNIDRGWRRILLETLRPVLERPDALVLDLCCGTGDVLLELQNNSRARVVGADFSRPMLDAAQQKIRSRKWNNPLLEADALHLPLADNSLDAIAISFGFRNLANYRDGFSQMHRILRPGGVLAILEFSHPPSLLVSTAYGFYSRAILPMIGGVISGSREAYTYLPASIRNFPAAHPLALQMVEAGFRDVRYQLLTDGIAALHVGCRDMQCLPGPAG